MSSVYTSSDTSGGYPQGDAQGRAIVQINARFDAEGFEREVNEYRVNKDLLTIPFEPVQTDEERKIHAGEPVIELLTSNTGTGGLALIRSIVNGITIPKLFNRPRDPTPEQKRNIRRAEKAAMYSKFVIRGYAQDTVEAHGRAKSVVVSHGSMKVRHTGKEPMAAGDTVILVLPDEDRNDTCRETLESKPLTRETLLEETFLGGEMFKLQEYQDMLDTHGMMFMLMFVNAQMKFVEGTDEEKQDQARRMLQNVQKFLEDGGMHSLVGAMKEGTYMKDVGASLCIGKSVAEFFGDDHSEPIRTQYAEAFIPPAGIAMNTLTSRIVGVTEHAVLGGEWYKQMICTPARLAVQPMIGL